MMKRTFVLCVLVLAVAVRSISFAQTCTSPVTSNIAFTTPCTGDIIIQGNSRILVVINTDITGNIIINVQKKTLRINSGASVSGSVIVNDQQVDLEVNGPIGGDLDINSQQVDLILASDIGGTLDLGQQQVSVDVTDNSTVGSIASSGQQNDFVVDNSNGSVSITLEVLNDVCVGDQQNTIETSSDDEVIIRGTVKCTGTGCNQFDFVGNVSASECQQESGTFCSDADLTIDPTLPIELLFFSATSLEDAIELKWATATEENNDYFTLQKSYNGVDFFDIAQMNGAGNSTETINYQYLDTNPMTGVTYYRLKQTDYDGSSVTFKALAIEFLGNGDFVKFFPNPVTQGRFTILSRLNDLGNTYSVYDYTGNEVQNGSLFPGENKVELGSNINKGMYFVKVKSVLNTEIASERLIVR